jgi:hypothetical protein
MVAAGTSASSGKSLPITKDDVANHVRRPVVVHRDDRPRPTSASSSRGIRSHDGKTRARSRRRLHPTSVPADADGDVGAVAPWCHPRGAMEHRRVPRVSALSVSHGEFATGPRGCLPDLAHKPSQFVPGPRRTPRRPAQPR